MAARRFNEKERRDQPSTSKSNQDYSSNKNASFEKIPYYVDILERDDILLNDQQVAKFIVQGYLVIESDLPASFHSILYNNAEKVPHTRNDNPGNNILPMLPSLQQVYDSPSVRGALKSLLGSNYVIHPHRHPHCNPPGFKEQQWHRDSYFGFGKPRHHIPRWVMAMYYPQDTVIQLGPTAVSPATQYYAMPEDKNRRAAKLPAAWGPEGFPVVCKAGSVVIIHYDIWHKGMGNQGDKDRWMFKFQFTRTEEPAEPSWNCQSTDIPTIFQEKECAPYRPLTPLWTYVWVWMCGNAKKVTLSNVNISQMAKILQDVSSEAEPLRLNAAYSLGMTEPKLQKEAKEVLFKLLTQSKEEATIRNAGFGLIAMGSDAIPEVLLALTQSKDLAKSTAAFILGEIGPAAAEKAFPIIFKIFEKDNNDFARRGLAEAVGNIGQSTQLTSEQVQEVATHLLRLVNNEKNDVMMRFHACLSLIKLAKRLSDNAIAKQLLVIASQDLNRYVKAYALTALTNIPTVLCQRSCNQSIVDLSMV